MIIFFFFLISETERDVKRMRGTSIHIYCDINSVDRRGQVF